MYRSIVEAVFSHAQEQPGRLCLADETGAFTYRQYAEKISAFACALAARGFQKGDAAAVEASQTADYLAFELALHLLGAVFVPLENRCGPEKLAETARLCGAKLVLSSGDASGCPCPALSFSQFRGEAGETSGQPDPTFPETENVSEILFSTGTTGKEKGIVLTHRSDIALAENVIAGVEMQEDNVELIPSPLNHSHGLRRYYANMVRGGAVVLENGVMNLKRLFGDMDLYGVNSMDLVPAALSVLLKLSKGKLADYRSRLRYVQLGAAALSEDDQRRLIELLPRTRLYNFYGSTESGCIVVNDFNRSGSAANCIGKPACNAEIFIVDDSRRPIRSSRENPGLLASRGPMNMTGYWNDPGETAKVLADGCVYSNDVAYRDENGFLCLLGRRGDVINVGGSKVSPEEIENAAKKLPGVADCGCIPVSDEIKGQVPKLFVQMAPGAVFDPAALREGLASQLLPFKVPKAIAVIEKIPRSYNGKLLRRELRSLSEVSES